ncbi:MAG: hypothetical protein U0441_31715 [Polyangiaceae bacterium]
MDQLFQRLKLHTLALLCFMVAGMMWKDYLSEPHERLSEADLAVAAGPVKQLSGLVSLPSGYGAGSWLLIGEPDRHFHLPGGLDRDLKEFLKEGDTVTVKYGPEKDPSKDDGDAFSLVWRDKEWLAPGPMLTSYNAALDRRLRDATLVTVAGFAAILLVEGLRKYVFPRVFGGR